MHAFDVLGDPVRRRILELLAGGEHASGAIVEAVQREYGITQSAVSQHLRVLRDSGFANVRVEGTRRIYAVDTAPLRDVDAWLEPFRAFWEPKLDALATEVARGKRKRRLGMQPPAQDVGDRADRGDARDPQADEPGEALPEGRRRGGGQ